MAADDITSQDGAVIGDDLVEALGFEPITADAGSGDEQRDTSTSEVAVLDDTSVEERTLEESPLDRPPGAEAFVEPPSGDDIEIIEDDPVDEAAIDEAVFDEEVVDDDLVDEAAVDDPESEIESFEPDSPTNDADVLASDIDDLASEPELDASSDATDLGADLDDDVESLEVETAEAEIDAFETDALKTDDQAETSLFGAAAPAYVWGQRKTDAAVDDAPVDDSAVDDLDEETDLDEEAELHDEVEVVEAELDDSQDDSSPVVFFNNAVDTDTAPLADLDLDEAASNEPALDVSDLDDTDLADLDDTDLDDPDVESPDAEIDLSDSPPAPGVNSLIDLDRGDDLAVGDKVIDEETVAIPVQRPPIDLPTDRELDVDLQPEPQTEKTLETTETQVEPVLVPSKGRRQKLRARKSRRVVRHIDPWSVLTFSVLFHLCFFAALLLASVLVWNAALAAGTIENIENFVRELGDYETFEINSDQVFKAATLIAGLLTLASSVLVVLLTVVFNLISDLIGGIRVTVIEEETVRIPRKSKK